MIWKGSTLDGHTLYLTRSGLTSIISQLRRSSTLKALVKTNLNGSLRGAIVRSIAQIVNKSRLAGVRSPNSKVFTAKVANTTYRILTQLLPSGQTVIVSIQPRRLVSREFFDLEIEQMAKSRRKSQLLTRNQRQKIRRLAVAIAQKIGHRKQQPSKRAKHQKGDSRRANDIERKALNAIDRGQSYADVINSLQAVL